VVEYRRARSEPRSGLFGALPKTCPRRQPSLGHNLYAFLISQIVYRPPCFPLPLKALNNTIDKKTVSAVAGERVAFAFQSPSAAASRFAEALDHATKGQALDTDPVRIRFGGIAAALALPLSGQPELLDYARGYDALVSNNTEEALSIFKRLGTDQVKVGDVVLRPEALIAAVASKEVVDAAEALPKISQGPAPISTSRDGISEKSTTVGHPPSFVFISYIRDNRDVVDQLSQELRARGVNVWLDRTEIEPGSRWRDAIRQAIQSGIFFIACFSREYNERDRTYMNE
jgi:hypothetical protein